MQIPFDWVKRIIGGNERGDVLALLTPESVRTRGPLFRFTVAGATAIALAMASGVALLSLGALMAAIAIVYFLSTQVLGLKINVDPSALYQEMQRQAAASAAAGNAAYGPN